MVAHINIFEIVYPVTLDMGLLGLLLKLPASKITGIAVGTPIAERPPHRSEHARFTHSAPTSGV